MLSHEFIVERAKLCGNGCHLGVATPGLDHLRNVLATATEDDWEALQAAWSVLQNYAHQQWANVYEMRTRTGKPQPGFEDLGGIIL